MTDDGRLTDATHDAIRANQVWKVADDSLVGFMPRIHTLNPAALAAASAAAAAAAAAGAGGASPAALRGAAAEEKGRIEGDAAASAADGEADADVAAGARAAAGSGEGEEGEGSGGGDQAQSEAKVPLFRYNGWWKVWWDGEYSLVLTKAAFLHRDFLRAYTEEMPARIRCVFLPFFPFCYWVWV